MAPSRMPTGHSFHSSSLSAWFCYLYGDWCFHHRPRSSVAIARRRACLTGSNLGTLVGKYPGLTVANLTTSSAPTRQLTATNCFLALHYVYRVRYCLHRVGNEGYLHIIYHITHTIVLVIKYKSSVLSDGSQKDRR